MTGKHKKVNEEMDPGKVIRERAGSLASCDAGQDREV